MDYALVAIDYLACAVPTAAIICVLGARLAARLYCVCLWVAPAISCIAYTVAATEQLTNAFPEMQRSLSGFLIVSVGGGALLGCQPTSCLTTREKWLTVAIYMSTKLLSFAILAVRIGHGREIAGTFLMDSAAFFAAVHLSLGLHLDHILKPPSAKVGFT